MEEQEHSLASKVKLMRTLILSTFLYACESWFLTAEIKRRIQALEMRCYRRLLNVTNEEVCNSIQNETGVHDELLTMVKKRKLRWYGHISRSSGMAKTILQGRVKGARRRGRQKKRWEDNIKEWTRIDFGQGNVERYCCELILYMHWYWQDVDLHDWTIFFVHFQQSYGPWLMSKFRLCSISCGPIDGLW